jgi:plastocyanin
MEETNNEETKVENSQPKSGGMNWMIPVIVVLIVIAAGGYYFMTKSSKDKMADNTMIKETPSTNTLQEGTTGEENMENSNGTQEGVVEGTGTPTNESAMAMVNSDGVQEITVEGGMYYFKPNKISVKKGTPVKITLTNNGGMHNFVIDALNVKSDTISSGKTTTVEFTPNKSGEFEFYCSIANHKAMGMVGTLVVE